MKREIVQPIPQIEELKHYVVIINTCAFKVRTVPEKWSLWPKHDKSIFWVHVVENIVSCQLLDFFTESINGKGPKHDFATGCCNCAAASCVIHRRIERAS